MKILNKRIYEISKSKQWILIVYNISANHYVGTPIFLQKGKNRHLIKSINRYIDFSVVSDYSQKEMGRCIYEKGKPLEISKTDYFLIIRQMKSKCLKYVDNKTKVNPDGLSYSRWCKTKLKLNAVSEGTLKVKARDVYWIDFGYNVGSELRKLRPGILWRSDKTKKMWTVIPLTTKRQKDKYYFHIDLKCLPEATAKIENLINISVKRIREPFYYKHNVAYISNLDIENIAKAIRKYYLFSK